MLLFSPKTTKNICIFVKFHHPHHLIVLQNPQNIFTIRLGGLKENIDHINYHHRHQYHPHQKITIFCSNKKGMFFFIAIMTHFSTMMNFSCDAIQYASR